MKTARQKNVLGQLKFILTLIAVTLVSCNARPQTNAKMLEGKWHLEMELADIGLTETVMEFKAEEGDKFEALTRKGAVNDILGNWNAMLAKTFTSSFKDGSLLRIVNGIYRKDADTLQFAGVLTSAVGNFKVQGYIAGEILSATISDKDNNRKGALKGSRNIPQLPLRDYRALFRETVSLTGSRIFNRQLLNTKEWRTFEERMDQVSAKLQDDVEMIFAFYYYAGKLPVSHYMLLRPSEQADTGATVKEYRQRAFFEEKALGTAYLRITSFEGSAAEMDSVFRIIANKNYRNLIVDLRNNPGGSVEAGMAFATHVADTTFYGGVFLTQKYFNTHKALPTVAEICCLSALYRI